MSKRYAGPTPDGTYISRTTDNDYGCAVAVIATTPSLWKPRDPAAVNGYVPNPELGQWVSYSWHRTAALATKKLEQARSHGYRAIIVPVIEGKPS